jgi:heme-degrading monooxygenase HmoA
VFVVLISFPPIKPGKQHEFEEWFTATNHVFSKFKGFVSRRLLKPTEESNYAAVVEFENREAFVTTHSSPEHDAAGDRVKSLFDGRPTPHFYEVAVG